MGLKRNNFIDYIFTSKINKVKASHSWKEAKEKIPISLKQRVWKTYFPNNKKKRCPITKCKKFILSDKFSTGHIVSEDNNGTLDLDNLYPICTGCNSQMGSKNWEDFDNDSYLKIQERIEELEV